MGTRVAYEQYASGATLYVKARPLDPTWATGIIAMAENGSTGEYSATVDQETQYGIYLQAAGAPASTDTAIGWLTNTQSADVDGYTQNESLTLILASAANKLAGATGPTVTIRDVADTKDRITATVDADGNRTAIVQDAT